VEAGTRRRHPAPVVDLQSLRGRGGQSRDRSGHSDLRRARNLDRHAARALLSRGARLPHLRRTLRGPSDGDRAKSSALMRFRDKVVWVTGASSGIGEAVAMAFAREGAKLVLSSRNVAELERVRKACAGEGHRVLPLDLTQPDTFADAASRAGQVDILVHSGGVSQRSLVVDTDLATDRAIMDLNFFGTVGLTKAV